MIFKNVVLSEPKPESVKDPSINVVIYGSFADRKHFFSGDKNLNSYHVKFCHDINVAVTSEVSDDLAKKLTRDKLESLLNEETVNQFSEKINVYRSNSWKHVWIPRYHAQSDSNSNLLVVRSDSGWISLTTPKCLSTTLLSTFFESSSYLDDMLQDRFSILLDESRRGFGTRNAIICAIESIYRWNRWLNTPDDLDLIIKNTLKNHPLGRVILLLADKNIRIRSEYSESIAEFIGDNDQPYWNLMPFVIHSPKDVQQFTMDEFLDQVFEK
jgi:hypothetical protein